MNRKQWIKYNHSIINKRKTEMKLGVTDGDIVDSLLNTYLDNRSMELHHAMLNDFNSPKSYAKLVANLCNTLASAESIMLGFVQILNDSDVKDERLLRHNANGIKKVIRAYFKRHLKGNNALRNYHHGLD